MDEQRPSLVTYAEAEQKKLLSKSGIMYRQMKRRLKPVRRERRPCSDGRKRMKRPVYNPADLIVPPNTPDEPYHDEDGTWLSSALVRSTYDIDDSTLRQLRGELIRAKQIDISNRRVPNQKLWVYHDDDCSAYAKKRAARLARARAVERAKTLLWEHLKDGPKRQTELLSDAARQKPPISLKALRRALKQLKGASYSPAYHAWWKIGPWTVEQKAEIKKMDLRPRRARQRCIERIRELADMPWLELLGRLQQEGFSQNTIRRAKGEWLRPPTIFRDEAAQPAVQPTTTPVPASRKRPAADAHKTWWTWHQEGNGYGTIAARWNKATGEDVSKDTVAKAVKRYAKREQ